jgi:hypothetical protein
MTVRHDAGPESTSVPSHPYSALKLPDTPGQSFLLKYRQRKWRPSGWKFKRNSPTKRHFFTLPLTLEDRELSVKEYRGGKCSFFQ